MKSNKLLVVFVVVDVVVVAEVVVVDVEVVEVVVELVVDVVFIFGTIKKLKQYCSDE